jgi:hypothetical protein
MAHLPLSLERFAALQAEIDAGMARDALLAREQLSLDTWLAAQRGWFELMAAEVKSQRFDLAQRYASLYSASKPELVGLSPPGDETLAAEAQENLGETMGVVGLNVRDVLPFAFRKPAEVAEERPSQPMMPATPFELRNQRARPEARPEPPPAPPPALEESLTLEELEPIEPAPPPRDKRPLPPPRTKRKRSRPPAPLPEERTLGLPADAQAETLPFEKGARVNPPAPVGADNALSGATQSLRLEDLPAPLPFAQDDDGDTQVRNDPLPFRSGAAPAPPPPSPNEPSLSGATMFVAAENLGETLPFDLGGASASKTTVEGWTVEQYASLCVELERTPSARDTVLARYRIDEKKRQHLEQQWNDKFAASTRLARVFLKARARYLEWLELKK